MLKRLSIISFMFCLILLIPFNIFPQNDYEGLLKLEEKSFSISSAKMLNLEAASGDINITAWDKNEVSIKIFGNEKAKEKLDFKFQNNSDEIKITAEKEGSFFNWNWFSSGIKIKFDIKIPSSFNSKVHTSGGDINLKGVTGNNNLNTSGGDVYAKEINGNLKISTSGGDVNLEILKGEINASTSGGDITANNFSGNLIVSTSGGDIKLRGKDSKINAETSGGNIDVFYSGLNKGIELHSSGGDINLNVPNNFNAKANLHTSGGDISCNLTANNAKKISSSRFEAELNNGGNLLIIKTSGGDISVLGK